MSDYTTKICAADDFERAFRLVQPLLKMQVMSMSLYNKITPGIANDTVAALLQARDLIRTMHEVGVELHELQGWLVEWGREWKEQEQDMILQKLAA